MVGVEWGRGVIGFRELNEESWMGEVEWMGLEGWGIEHAFSSFPQLVYWERPPWSQLISNLK